MRYLIEDCSQLLQGQNPQGVGRDGDDAFRALFRGEAGSVLERLVRERCEMEAILVSVGEPSPAGHGQHGIVPLHADAEELDRLGTEISRAGVGEITRHRV